ncbi:MAG: hypothetical protein ABI741_03015 [Ferruginibacter sp.]
MKLKNSLSLLFSCCAITASCQQPKDQINILSDTLSKGETTISAVLSDSSLMSLHSLTPFRELIKQYAKAGEIKLNNDNEPGTKIKIKGMIIDRSGIPLADKLVYVYQTSSEGWYSDTAPHILKNEGDRRHARLFGYFKTGAKGEFEFYTVKPKGYPNSSLPAHIHIEISQSAERSFISELLFDDDPRLVGEIRVRSVSEQFLIEKNIGTKAEPLYSYTIQIPD